jgi:hypothetical protein
MPPDPFYKTPEEMQKAIEKYFGEDLPSKTAYSNGVPYQVPVPTISGLALYLGFADRYSLYEYEKKDAFTYTIKKARALITQYYEERSQVGACSGAIFMLKNFGYTDKTEMDVNQKVYEMPTIKKDGKEVKFDIGSSETTRSSE